MPHIDTAKVADIICAVAAAEIMPRFRKLAAADIEMKAVNDPVTVADKESERRLTEELTRMLPGSVVIGEETFARDKAIMSHLDRAQPIWVIDPIDGTRNFVAGVPEFAVMVALVRDRKPIASWIHDPNSGDIIMGEQGGGVWLRGQRLALAPFDSGQPLVGLVGSRVKKLISDPSLLPKGMDGLKIEIGSCAGFDYPRLFAGPVNFANSTAPRAAFLFYRHTNAWDHAAGLFLHQEGGGYSANWAGEPYDMANNRSGLLYAPNKETWLRLHELFQPLMDHALKKAS